MTVVVVGAPWAYRSWLESVYITQAVRSRMHTPACLDRCAVTQRHRIRRSCAHRERDSRWHISAHGPCMPPSICSTCGTAQGHSGAGFARERREAKLHRRATHNNTRMHVPHTPHGQRLNKTLLLPINRWITCKMSTKTYSHSGGARMDSRRLLMSRHRRWATTCSTLAAMALLLGIARANNPSGEPWRETNEHKHAAPLPLGADGDGASVCSEGALPSTHAPRTHRRHM